MTSGFALGFVMDYILFEIAAFPVFQHLFRKICRTHSYAMNIHEFRRYSMDKNTSQCRIWLCFSAILVIFKIKVIFLLNFHLLKAQFQCAKLHFSSPFLK